MSAMSKRSNSRQDRNRPVATRGPLSLNRPYVKTRYESGGKVTTTRRDLTGPATRFSVLGSL
jgi:hypothetical protein